MDKAIRRATKRIGALALASLLAMACSNDSSGPLTVEQCWAVCDRAIADGCLSPGTCSCEQDDLDRAYRCFRTMGCGNAFDALNSCVLEHGFCSVTRGTEECMPEMRAADGCRRAFCDANVAHECCGGSPPPPPPPLPDSGSGRDAGTDTGVATMACTNGVRDGDESSTDCGGSCPACRDGDNCRTSDDCESSVCDRGRCLVPSCIDGVQNGTETGTDCGGGCGLCAGGEPCTSNDECSSGRCRGGTCEM